MITGFNTDVEHRGTVFHVQTEERGPSNPVMITLVYAGGQVIASLETAYASTGAVAAPSNEQLRERMRLQHQNLIDAIRRGTYDPSPRPFGEEYVSNRTLDEVVLGCLEEELSELASQRATEREIAELRGMPSPVKVQRVLDRLERFLDAAQRAEVQPERRVASPATVATPALESRIDPVVATATSAARPTVRPEPRVAEPVADRRERDVPAWVWLTTAAVLFAGGVSLFFFGSRPQVTERPVPVSSSAEHGSPPSVTSSAAPVEASVVAPVVPEKPDPSPVDDRPPTVDSTADVPVEKPSPTPVEHEETPSARTRRTVEPEVARLKPLPASRTDPDPVETTAPTPPPTRERDPAPPTPAPLVPGTLVGLEEVDVAPMPRQRDLPRYTRRARRLNQEGRVRLGVLIDHLGKVREVELLEDVPDSDLGMASVAAANGWAFSPARKDGVAVSVRQEIELRFSLLANGISSVRIEE
jgi:protein TonB